MFDLYLLNVKSFYVEINQKLTKIVLFLFRFIHTSADVQKQALLWLQKLCLLEIPIPLDVLFDMLNSGLDALVKV